MLERESLPIIIRTAIQSVLQYYIVRDSLKCDVDGITCLFAIMEERNVNEYGRY
jgi:hypothetical protein